MYIGIDHEHMLLYLHFWHHFEACSGGLVAPHQTFVFLTMGCLRDNQRRQQRPREVILHWQNFNSKSGLDKGKIVILDIAILPHSRSAATDQAWWEKCLSLDECQQPCEGHHDLTYPAARPIVDTRRLGKESGKHDRTGDYSG